MSKASEMQVGGNHYKEFPIQPSEFCQRNGLNWCESNAVKYVARHRSKNGRQDIEKAIHYLNLLLEWEYPQPDTAIDRRLAALSEESLCENCVDRKKCDKAMPADDHGVCLYYKEEK